MESTINFVLDFLIWFCVGFFLVSLWHLTKALLSKPRG